jgi:pyruvate/2-oxoglutarate dehydrogenase complex dihydrolipoamide acyltransferase (E2) component
LTRVTAQAGDEVPVGQTIALILAAGEHAAATTVQHPHSRIESGAGSSPLPEGEGIRGERLQATQQAQSNPPVSPVVKGGSRGISPRASSPRQKPGASHASRQSISNRCEAADPKAVFSPPMCCAPQVGWCSRRQSFQSQQRRS